MSASVGLLCDLFGELGAARGDQEAARLARMLDLIQGEADRVGDLLAVPQRVSRTAIVFNNAASSSVSARSAMN